MGKKAALICSSKITNDATPLTPSTSGKPIFKSKNHTIYNPRELKK